ncbi:MAG: carbohydrate-binding domain-containing protein [Bacteroidaceae bacterium]|nr:carbohydrate-binding domain-containing protein [Bacteroidaceae bacterium]
MKKLMTLMVAIISTMATVAQTLNVTIDNVTYQFPASKCGEMTYSDGTALTILNKTFTLNDITSMTIDQTEVTDNLVSIAYNGSSATVTVAGNVAQYVTPTISGAHVTIAQSNTAAVDDDEITYQLSGTTTDGSFSLSGSYKCTVSLADVTLTNPSGAAINITNSKRIQLSAKKNTTNTITDGSGSQKACIYSKGQLQLQGNGTLNVVGNYKHGIKSASYISIKNLTLNITSAVGDGINCEEYLQMKSGTVTISGVGDDGIQCDLDDTTSTGETTDHEDEDSGNIYLEGGTLTVTTTAAASKGVKSEGDIVISDGEINITTTGTGTYDSDEKDAKGCGCLKSDGNMTISGGTLTLKSTGSGGKCIKTDGTLTISDGTISATTTGGTYSYSSSKAQPKAIKSDGNMTVSGGSVTASSSSHEAIETKGTLTITEGTVYAFSSSDDAINSASHMYLKGGTVSGISNGNDGIDSNGNMYISGGKVLACGAGEPECGLDAAERYYLYITGGTVLGIGGGNNSVTSTTGSQCVVSTTGSVTAGSTVTLKSSSTTLASFTVPSNYSPTSSGGGGGGGRGGGGGFGPGGGSSNSSNFSYLLSSPDLTSGTSYTITIGSTSSTAKASTSYSGK